MFIPQAKTTETNFFNIANPMKFHYISRGVCLVDDCVLLAKAVGATNTFLPGGHIEFAENAMDALEREIFEELGVKARVQNFLGAVEHCYDASSRDNHEINLVFSFDSDELSTSTVDPTSNESHLEFFWCPISHLGRHNLLPPPIAGLFTKPTQHWGSTLDRKHNENNA